MRQLTQSSEKRVLQSAFCCGQMLQNLPSYFMCIKNPWSIFHFVQLWVLPLWMPIAQCPGLCQQNIWIGVNISLMCSKQLEVLRTYVHFSGFTEVFALYGISSNANWMVLCLKSLGVFLLQQPGSEKWGYHLSCTLLVSTKCLVAFAMSCVYVRI